MSFCANCTVMGSHEMSSSERMAKNIGMRIQSVTQIRIFSPKTIIQPTNKPGRPA